MNDPIVLAGATWAQAQTTIAWFNLSGLYFSERNPEVGILIGQLSYDAIVLAGAFVCSYGLVYKALCSNIATLYRSNHSTRTGCHRIIFPLFTYTCAGVFSWDRWSNIRSRIWPWLIPLSFVGFNWPISTYCWRRAVEPKRRRVFVLHFTLSQRPGRYFIYTHCGCWG